MSDFVYSKEVRELETMVRFSQHPPQAPLSSVIALMKAHEQAAHSAAAMAKVITDLGLRVEQLETFAPSAPAERIEQ